MITFLLSLAMSKAGDSGGGGDGVDKAPALTKFSSVSSGPGWTKVSCPCCVKERVEPLVLVKLGGKVCPDTKRWLIKLIGNPQKDGGNLFNICIYMHVVARLSHTAEGWTQVLQARLK